MSFPDSKIADIGSYTKAYFAEIETAAASLDDNKLIKAARILTKVYSDGGMVYSCGNGGSAAIANHLVCSTCFRIRITW